MHGDDLNGSFPSKREASLAPSAHSSSATSDPGPSTIPDGAHVVIIMFYRNPSSLTCLLSMHPWFEHQALERPPAEGFCEIDIRHGHLIDMMSIARCGVVFDGTVEVPASVMRVWTYIILFINSTTPLIYVGRKFGAGSFDVAFDALEYGCE